MTDAQTRTIEQQQGFNNNNNPSVNNISSMAPPQDYTYDQPVSTSASQSRGGSNWSNANGTSYVPPQATTWNGQSQTNGSIIASSSAAYNSSSSYSEHNFTRPPAPNGITINTSNLPISNNSTIINTEGISTDLNSFSGHISQLNTLADETGAKYVIHTGDFGFYETSTLERINTRALRYLVRYSNLVSPQTRARLIDENVSTQELRSEILGSENPLLSEFPLLLDGRLKLKVPVYAVWGSCEDICVLENFRSKKYVVPNLFILDESNTQLIVTGNVNLRLFGLGGAVVPHKLFDNGEGTGTIAGGGGTMWTTTLQIGELIDTAQKFYHPSETRVLVTHNSPGRVGLLAQLSLVLRADFTISAGLHFRYCVSYNEFAVQCDQENFRSKLENSRKSFYHMYNSIKEQVEKNIDTAQKTLLDNALTVVNRVPAQDKEELAFKNIWNFNLPDAAFGYILLDISDGRISAETKSQGFNFAHRRNNMPADGPNGTTTNSVNQAPDSPNAINPVSRRQPSQWQTLTPPQAPPSIRSQSPNILNNRSVSPANINDQGGNNSSFRYDTVSSLHVPNETISRKGTPSPNDFPETKTNSSMNSNYLNNNKYSNYNLNGDIHRSESPKIGNNNNIQNEDDDDSSSNSQLNHPPVTAEDLKNVFSSVKDGIDKVRILYEKTDPSIQRNFAYVDFLDEASLQKALLLNGEKLREDTLVIKRAEDRSFYDYRNRGGRGRSRGRGNYRGNYRGGPHHHNGGGGGHNGGQN
ncbi:4583_t:CDS:10 [Ambispora gerdemannii]|uniref:4583_t:CDS:1 n=1 Tax=Ambispora gerdemannii TaxID=144530 RepID=A0A9N9B5X1_9GLOM|nr:4583_t:CDS:10 [Ambispora gerdemannii]